MTLNEFILSIKGKLTASDYAYLEEHPLDTTLDAATRLSDNSDDAQTVCRDAVHKYIVQMILATKQCPGILTSWVYACGYEYMTARLRGRTGKGNFKKIPSKQLSSLPTTAGRPLVFTLLHRGSPLLFRDSRGTWYSWLSPLTPNYACLFDPSYALWHMEHEHRVCIHKHLADRCYRKHHPEYTTIGRK